MASLGEKDLASKGVSFTSHEYDYRQKGAERAAQALDLEPAATIKSLVLKLSDKRFIFLLLPADADVSMRSVARTLGVKSAEMATERDAERLTNYKAGGMSPFGSRTRLPVYVDLSVLDHDRVYVNGGRRGLLLGLDPEDLISAADAEIVDVGIR